jgi:Carboxypeptidase regulatory-like domain/AhpC/TSA family
VNLTAGRPVGIVERWGPLGGVPMRRGRALLFAVVVLAAAPGCRFFERLGKSRDDDTDPYRPPKNWADTAGRDNGRGTDPRAEFKGILSGVVLDPDGGRVPYQDIRVEKTDGGTGGAEVTVQTDRNGYFVVRGLKPNQSYTLIARAKQGGRQLAAQSVARTPSPAVRLQLRDDIDLPPAPAGTAPSLFDPPKPPPAGGPPRPDARPLKSDADELPLPKETRGADWSPGSAAPPAPVTAPPPRADLVAPANTGLAKPPAANIPNPITPLLPPPSLSKFGPTQADGFDLIDPMGRPRTFPAGRPGERVLLHFLTTTTEASTQAAKRLNAVQAKWVSAGLEVIGVVTDDVPPAERVIRAKKFAETAALNHLVYSEGGPVAGAVAGRFGVNTFPTAVLIDAAGAVLWQGDPRDPAGLEAALGK